MLILVFDMRSTKAKRSVYLLVFMRLTRAIISGGTGVRCKLRSIVGFTHVVDGGFL